MNSEYTLYVTFAAIAFGAALYSVVIEWLKSDVSSAVIQAGINTSMLRRHAFEIGSGGAVTIESLQAAKTEAPATPPSAMIERPEMIGDDETALARLCLGWGGAGMVLGMASGAAMWGYVGALLGAVVLSAASIGLVVIAVLILDRVRLTAWNAAMRTA